MTEEQHVLSRLRTAEAERAAAAAILADKDRAAEEARQRQLASLVAAHESAALLAAAGRGQARARMASEVNFVRAVAGLPADQVSHHQLEH